MLQLGSYSRTNAIFLSIQFLSILPNVPFNFMKQYKTLLTCCFLSYISDTWFPIETQPCFNKWRERKRKWKNVFIIKIMCNWAIFSLSVSSPTLQLSFVVTSVFFFSLLIITILTVQSLLKHKVSWLWYGHLSIFSCHFSFFLCFFSSFFFGYR